MMNHLFYGRLHITEDVVLEFWQKSKKGPGNNMVMTLTSVIMLHWVLFIFFSVGYLFGRRSLRKRLVEVEKCWKTWSDDYDNDKVEIKEICRPIIGDLGVDGDSYGVPTHVDIVGNAIQTLLNYISNAKFLCFYYYANGFPQSLGDRQAQEFNKKWEEEVIKK